MAIIKSVILIAFLMHMILYSPFAEAQNSETKQTLTERQRAITLIAAFTTKGELTKLKQSLNTGLDAGLTVNECKEVLVHLYAYCGFPRSIRGLQTLMETLDERKSKGINDNIGRPATPLPKDTNKYETGWKNLAKLDGRSTDGPIEKPTRGYGAFSPEIEIFLKEHLFADLFSRDLLTFAERELTTASVLIALGGVEPMLGSHITLAIKQGITPTQLNEILSLFEKSVSKEDAKSARKVFSEILSRN